MPAESNPADAFIKLAQNLGELEVVIGPKARTTIVRVREGLMNAAAARDRGDMPGALEQIRNAMAQLAALGAELDPAEGMMMRAIAERFAAAMGEGAKGDVKNAVDTMRRKAGDGGPGEKNDW